MAAKSKYTEKQKHDAVKRYMDGTASVPQLAKEYKMSVAGMYLWMKAARENAAQDARKRDIGAAGVETETRISKDMQIKELQRENRELKAKLFELMLKHKEI